MQAHIIIFIPHGHIHNLSIPSREQGHLRVLHLRFHTSLPLPWGLMLMLLANPRPPGCFSFPSKLSPPPFYLPALLGYGWFALPRLLAAPFQEVQMLTPFRLDSITSFLSWCSVYDMIPDDDMIKTKEGREEKQNATKTVRSLLTTRPLSSCPRQSTFLRQPVLSAPRRSIFS